MAPRSHVAWGMVGTDYQLARESAYALLKTWLTGVRPFLSWVNAELSCSIFRVGLRRTCNWALLTVEETEAWWCHQGQLGDIIKAASLTAALWWGLTALLTKGQCFSQSFCRNKEAAEVETIKGGAVTANNSYHWQELYSGSLFPVLWSFIWLLMWRPQP